MLYPVLLTVAALAALLLPPVLRLPDLPVAVPLALVAAALAWSLALWYRRGERPFLLLGVFQGLLGAGLVWWIFGLSTYVAPDGAPRASAEAPDIEAVRVPDGAEFRLSAQRGRPLVLVFFRGPW